MSLFRKAREDFATCHVMISRHLPLLAAFFLPVSLLAQNMLEMRRVLP